MMNRGHRRAEKRKFSRLEQQFPVTVLEAQVIAESSGSPAAPNSYLANAIARKATGTNISKGGLAFEAKRPYRIATILAFEVVLPQPQEDFLPLVRRFVQRQIRGFRALCQVVWVGAISMGHYHMGVRFIDTNERRASALDQVLTEFHWQQRLMSSVEDTEHPFTDSDDDWQDSRF